MWTQRSESSKVEISPKKPWGQMAQVLTAYSAGSYLVKAQKQMLVVVRLQDYHELSLQAIHAHLGTPQQLWVETAHESFPHDFVRFVTPYYMYSSW